MFDTVFGNFLTIKDVLVRVAAAILLSTFVGVEREKRNRPAGMRTHVLVCIGATLVSMVEQQIVANVAALDAGQINVSVGRLTAAVVQGIGFLGAGTIIMSDKKVTGLTTAASVWCTACMGIAIGAGLLPMAVICCVAMVIVLELMQKVVVVPTYKTLKIQFVKQKETVEYVDEFFEKHKVKVLDIDFRAINEGDSKIFSNVYTLIIPNKTNYVEIVEALFESEFILTVETSNA